MWKPRLLYLLSFFMVAWGQPVESWILGLLASCLGYALFWLALLYENSSKSKFWIATVWFFSISAVQLSWFIAHPYLYIWGVYLPLSFGLGLQFGLLTLFVRPVYLSKLWKCAAISGLWTLFEWSRLFFLSGFSWNPAGLALTGHLYPLQLASVAGVFGLSFWVMFVNLLALRAFFSQTHLKKWAVWATAALFPYFFGFLHLTYHDKQLAQSPPKELSALLVQTAFPIEECLDCPPSDLITYVKGEWLQVFNLLKGHREENFDLIAFPEYLVPFGTWTPVWSWSSVKPLMIEMWGEEALRYLPPLEAPWAHYRSGEWHVTNAFFLQGIANLFRAEVISGLEDAERKENKVEYYNAALMFKPWDYTLQKRYQKRVLVPMGEYIPFEFCRELAACYGVTGSFTPGEEAIVFPGKKGGYGLSICYEETYGHLMRENTCKGANVLLNLTSDVWYPNSTLSVQHLDHARLRTLEGGLPLLRACNTGVTCAINSLGRTLATLGPEEWQQKTLKVNLPLYQYKTLYTYTGDTLILSFSGVLTLLFFVSSFLQRKNKIP